VYRAYAESAVLATVSARARSLSAIDRAVCVLNDAPWSLG
jgi:hypothetical protein